MGISVSSFKNCWWIILLIISYEMVFEKRLKRKKLMADDFSE